jgi:mannose-6-phosphate isomerase-like protein (cupin superfamily)
MLVFKLQQELAWNSTHHVEKILGEVGAGDISVACWEPGQISPYHCHPDATEVYFCFYGGGSMRTPTASVDMAAGSFVVHPPGELHEFTNGAQRTVLLRVRYGTNLQARHCDWRGNPAWKQSAADAEYFREYGPE